METHNTIQQIESFDTLKKNKKLKAQRWIHTKVTMKYENNKYNRLISQKIYKYNVWYLNKNIEIYTKYRKRREDLFVCLFFYLASQ